MSETIHKQIDILEREIERLTFEIHFSNRLVSDTILSALGAYRILLRYPVHLQLQFEKCYCNDRRISHERAFQFRIGNDFDSLAYWQLVNSFLCHSQSLFVKIDQYP